MPSCRITSWDSYGNLSVLIDGKKYNYVGVYIDLHIRLETYLEYRNYKAFFKLINNLERSPYVDKR